MSEHKATIEWQRNGPDFLKGRYSREHTWSFDGGVTVAASPSPAVVPVPWSNPAMVDPEEAFVAAVASCHMLTYLWVASRAGYVVESYRDVAVGVMTKNERGVPWVSLVTLRPVIVYGGEKQPTAAEIGQLHHFAHEQCFIANSIKTEVKVETAGAEFLTTNGHE
jgi:organic hydroperoxide reductase OsmC/OhrA